MLRILHVSADDVTGGAARCAYRLHQGLLEVGCDSTMLVSRRRSNDPAVLRFQPSPEAAARTRARIRGMWIQRSVKPYESTRPDGYERFSDDRSVTGADLVDQLPGCDVVNLHWVAGLMDYRSFFEGLPDDMPVVWTLHDMNAFTGGCHYSDGCVRFQDQCGTCPQLGSDKATDLSWQIWRRKYDVFSSLPRHRLHIVTPSRWLASEVERSSVLGDRFPISVIPYGVDTTAFAPRDPGPIRDALGIPQTAKVLLFGAHQIDNRRKGFAPLAAALEQLADLPDLFLLTVGKGRPALARPIPGRHVTYLEDDGMLSMLFSAADLLVLPSLEDNLPAMALEAMACGLPTVAFDAGGIPDAVRPGVTGALARVGDADQLAAAIASSLEHPARLRELSSNCRRIAVQEYPLSVQAKRYAELYESLLPERAESVMMPATPNGRLESVQV